MSGKTINNSSFMGLFHSLLFEEMADLAALENTKSFNDSQSSILTRKRFHAAFANLFPQFNPVKYNPFVNPKHIENPISMLPSYKNPELFSSLAHHQSNQHRFSEVQNVTTEQVEDPCHLITSEESERYEDIAFVLELIIQPIFICIGFLFNTIAISVLRSDRHPQLNNIFNGLLLWLAVFDNCFMVSCLLENIWRHYGGVWHYVFIIGYCFILYPFKNFALTCITNTQVSLSIERFKAIRHPIEYHRNNTNPQSRYRIVRSYVGSVVLAALIFCMPKLFESEIVEIPVDKLTHDNESNILAMTSNKQYTVDFSDLRFNKYYVLVYNIAIRQLVTAFIPFIMIVSFNVKTFIIINRRQKLSPRLHNTRSQVLNHQAAKQSYVLLAILGVFGVCHIPRFILAVNEFVMLDLIQDSLTNGCHVVKFWTLLLNSISQTLLAFNSSINFLMYPAFSKDFRSICREYITSKIVCISKIWPQYGRTSSRGSDAVEELNLDSSPVSPHSVTPTFDIISDKAHLENRAILLGQITSQENIEAAIGEEKSYRTQNCVSNTLLPTLGTPMINNTWLKVSISKNSSNNDIIEESYPCLIPVRSLVATQSSISIADHTVCNDL